MTNHFVIGGLILHSSSFVYFLEVEEEVTIRLVKKNLDYYSF